LVRAARWRFAIGCRSSIKVIKAALVGNDRDEHIFALTRSRPLYDVYQTKIAACDRKLEAAVVRNCCASTASRRR